MKIGKLKTGEKLSFQKIFFLFIIFSFIGCLYEDVLFLVTGYFNNGTVNYVTKRGLLYFELSPIYGWGACLMIYLLTRKKLKKSEFFWYGALIGGTFEYLISFLQELFTGTTSWDYSNYFLNIDGRTTIPYMLFWGLLAFLLMTKIYPFISKYLDIFLTNLDLKFYYIILTVIIVDMLLSFTACIRLGLRHSGYEPVTFYGEFLDKYYDDERMSKSYTNMEVRR